MKGLTWKKIMSLVLVAALVIGCLQLNARKVSANGTSATAEVTSASAAITEGANTLEPTLEFTVVANSVDDPTDNRKKTDVVLVIDLSGSMEDKDGSNKSKLDLVKEAAKDFSDQLLGGDNKDLVQIAVASYGKTPATVIGLTDKDGLEDLKTAIDGMNPVEARFDEDGERGTNIQAGIREAESILAASNATNKVIVLLSDGKATYAYKDQTSWQSVNGKPSGLTKTGEGWSNWTYYTYYVDRNGVEYRSHTEYDWFDSYTRYEKKVTKEVIFGDGTESQNATTMSQIKEATKDEAVKANKSYEIITIAYGSGADSALMADLAKSKTTNVAGTSIIGEIFEKIGKVIKNTIVAGTEGKIVATLGDEIIKNGDLPAGVTINGNQIEWKVNYKVDDKGNVTWGVLDDTYESGPIALKVNATADALAAKYPVVNGYIEVPVSSNGVLYYTDKDGKPATKDVTSTETVAVKVPVITYTIKYEQENLDGTFTQIGDNVYKYAWTANQVVKADTKTAAQLGLDTTIFNDPDCNVAADENRVIEVKAYRNTATVIFKVMTKGEDDAYSYTEANKTENVKYGTKITVGIGEVAPYSTFEEISADVVSGSAATYNKETVHEFKNSWKLNDTDTVVDDGTEEYEVKEDITFFALYDNAPVVVTKNVYFYVDGKEYAKRTDEIGKSFTKPENPTKVADKANTYEFKYWSLTDDGAEADVVSTIPTENVTYYAVFDKTPVMYTVTFIVDGENIGTQEFGYGAAFVPNGDFVTAANNAADGKDTVSTDTSFTGWDTTGEVVEDVPSGIVDDKVYSDATATAKFETKNLTCTITYLDENGVEIKEFTTTVARGTTEIKVPAGPEKAADTQNKVRFFFNGWYNDGVKLEELIKDGVLEDITVQAVYDEERYATLTFYKKAFESESNEVLGVVEYTENTTKAEFAALAPNGAALLGDTFDYWKAVVKQVVIREEKAMRIAPQANPDDITFEMVAAEYPDENPVDVIDIEFYPVFKAVKPTQDPVVTQIIILPPVVTETPEEPTATPTEVPATPTPVEEEPIVVEEPETPEGDVELEVEEPETPEGAPEEEELDVEPIDTPQGDLPKTGVAPSAVFFGIGAACVVFGGAIVLKLRRKEEM